MSSHGNREINPVLETAMLMIKIPEHQNAKDFLNLSTKILKDFATPVGYLAENMALSYCFVNDFTHSFVETTKMYVIIPFLLNKFAAIDRIDGNIAKLIL
jgi:hypothetical protein